MIKELDDESIIEELRENLKIDKNDLDTVISQQPSAFGKVAEMYANAASRRDYLKEEVSRVAAKLYKAKRLELEASGAKATEASIQNEITLSKKYRLAQSKYLDAKMLTEKLLALKESYHMRSYMLRDLVALFMQNYYDSGAIKDSADIKNFKGEKAKEAIGRVRQESGSRKSRRKRN